MVSRGQSKIDLLYLVGTFPVLSETFIQREILELLRDKNLNVRVFAFRNGTEDISLSPKLKSGISYFHPTRPKVLVDNIIEFFRSPARYLGLVRLVLRGEYSRPVLRRWDLASLLVGISFSREIRNLDVSRVHSQWATWPTTIALAVSELRGIPFSFTAHAHDIYKNQMLLKEKISRAKVVVTISDFNRDYLRKLADPRDRDKIFTIYLGVNFMDFRLPPKKKANHPPLILAVGRLIPYKGFSYLIDALELVKRQGRDFRAVIIGGGPEFRHLRKKIAEKGLAGEVGLLGALPFGKVKSYFGKADLFVAPSVVEPEGQFDGIPVVLFEAMGAKVPVIATRISGLPEAVADGENGLLVGERDAESLAAAICKLLDSPGLRKRMGEAGFRRGRKDFDLRKNVERFKRVVLIAEPSDTRMLEF